MTHVSFLMKFWYLTKNLMVNFGNILLLKSEPFFVNLPRRIHLSRCFFLEILQKANAGRICRAEIFYKVSLSFCDLSSVLFLESL